MTTTTRTDIANLALGRLGEEHISGLSDLPDLDLAYEPLVGTLLALKDWNFAGEYAALVRDASAPTGRYQYAYLLPELGTERVGNPRAFYYSSQPRARKTFRFDLRGRWVYADHDTLFCEYTARKNEPLWPGYFIELVAEALAAKMALPLTENSSRAELHHRNAYGTPSQNMRGGMVALAEQLDDMYEATPSLIEDSDPITEARFGTGSAGDIF